MTRRTLLTLAFLFALLTACAPTQTAAPRQPYSPLATGQVWKMQTPAGPVLLERTLTVGERELQTDGTVAYASAPERTLTGSTEDVFLFVPREEGRDVVLAGRAEQTFDLRFFDFCAIPVGSGGALKINAEQRGVYFKAASLDQLRRSKAYRAYLTSGEAAGLPACTLLRQR